MPTPYDERADEDQAASLRADAHDLALTGVLALASGTLRHLDDAVMDLVMLVHHAAGADVVGQVLRQRLIGVLRERWTRGWEPVDLHHVVQRASLHQHAEPPMITLVTRLLGDAMADDLSTYPRPRVEARWWNQLGAAEAAVQWEPAETFVRMRARQAGDAQAFEAALRLETVLRSLPPLHQLAAPPGEAVPAGSTASPQPAVDDKILARVRQLLAKAESTPYEAEAETFTAGAQALMARHSIDHAVLAASRRSQGAPGERPAGRRLWLETPYVREKVLLVGSVADANRTRTVWDKELGHVTLLGFDHDLDAVETLYTSLLVQATRAMHAEGKRVDRHGGSRTRSFRQSFLAAFGARIGERLADVTAHETTEAANELRATGGGELVPVLTERTQEVEALTVELFPRLRSVSMSLGRDREGYAKGRQAADRADLRWGRAVEH